VSNGSNGGQRSTKARLQNVLPCAAGANASKETGREQANSNVVHAQAAGPASVKQRPSKHSVRLLRCFYQICLCAISGKCDLHPVVNYRTSIDCPATASVSGLLPTARDLPHTLTTRRLHRPTRLQLTASLCPGGIAEVVKCTNLSLQQCCVAPGQASVS
jgi:hypothetical protein